MACLACCFASSLVFTLVEDMCMSPRAPPSSKCCAWSSVAARQPIASNPCYGYFIHVMVRGRLRVPIACSKSLSVRKSFPSQSAM